MSLALPRSVGLVLLAVLFTSAPGNAQSLLSDDDLRFREDVELNGPFHDEVVAARRHDIQAAAVAVGAGGLSAGTIALVSALFVGINSRLGPFSQVQLLGGGAAVFTMGLLVLAVPVADLAVKSAKKDAPSLIPQAFTDAELSRLDAEDLQKRADREQEVGWLVCALFGGSGASSVILGLGLVGATLSPRLLSAAGTETPVGGIEQLLLGAGALGVGFGVTLASLAVYAPFSAGAFSIENRLRTQAAEREAEAAKPEAPDAPDAGAKGEKNAPKSPAQ